MWESRRFATSRGGIARSPAMSFVSEADVDAFLRDLPPFPIHDIGSLAWWERVETWERIRAETVRQARLDVDRQTVHRSLLLHEKYPSLVWEVLSVEAWRNHVLKRAIEERDRLPLTSALFPYYILFHELTCMNVLEVTLYEEEAVLSLVEGEGDENLSAYCVRSLFHILSPSHEDQGGLKGEWEELVEGEKKIRHGCAIASISILRYLTAHLNRLGVGVSGCLLRNHDLPLLLLQLLDKKPWIRSRGQRSQYYQDGQWREMEEGEDVMIKAEVGIWMILVQILLGPDASSLYPIDSSRKNRLLKLRNHLTERLLDRLPFLNPLRRWLMELSLVDPHGSRGIPNILVFGEASSFEGSIDWEKVWGIHRERIFRPSQDSILHLARLMTSVYTREGLEELVEGISAPTCVCGKPATSRCSRCRNRWYCSRPCQVEDWGKHKPMCDADSQPL